MTARTPSLPTVIGPTENALRALLATIISTSPVATYEHWVAINAIASAGDNQVQVIAVGLQRSHAESAAVVDELETGGLVERRGDGWRLSALGSATLAPLRAAIAGVTAELVVGLDDSELATTLRVLEAVRTKALGELARRTSAADRQ